MSPPAAIYAAIPCCHAAVHASGIHCNTYTAYNVYMVLYAPHRRIQNCHNNKRSIVLTEINVYKLHLCPSLRQRYLSVGVTLVLLLWRYDGVRIGIVQRRGGDGYADCNMLLETVLPGASIPPTTMALFSHSYVLTPPPLFSCNPPQTIFGHCIRNFVQFCACFQWMLEAVSQI